MVLRAISQYDIERISEIWKRYYSDEFTFPDFTKMLCGYLVEDNDGKIVSAGGINLIAETIILTNKDFNSHKRWKAILELLEAGRFIAKKNGYNQLHASIQDKVWQDHLVQLDFRPINGTFMVKDL